MSCSRSIECDFLFCSVFLHYYILSQEKFVTSKSIVGILKDVLKVGGFSDPFKGVLVEL